MNRLLSQELDAGSALTQQELMTQHSHASLHLAYVIGGVAPIPKWPPRGASGGGVWHVVLWGLLGHTE